MARGQQLSSQIGDPGVILGVHHHHPTGLRDRSHRRNQHVIGELEAVGHVGLERRTARRDDLRDFRQRLRFGVEQRHVQAVIYDGAPVGLGAACGQRVAQRRRPSRRLRLDEVKHRRRPTARRGHRAGDPIVAGTHRARGHLQMHVRINAAGDHQFPSGVYHVRAGESLPDGRDALAANPQIGALSALRGNQRAVAYDRVVVHDVLTIALLCSDGFSR